MVSDVDGFIVVSLVDCSMVVGSDGVESIVVIWKIDVCMIVGLDFEGCVVSDSVVNGGNVVNWIVDDGVDGVLVSIRVVLFNKDIKTNWIIITNLKYIELKYIRMIKMLIACNQCR